MKKFKNVLVTFLAVSFLCGTFAACGASETSSSGSEDNGSGSLSSESSSSGGTSEVVVGITSDSSEKEMMQAVIAAYTSKHRDVNVRIKQISGNYSQQIVNLASSGDLPDVYMNYDTLVGYLAKSNVSLDLTPYMADYNISADDFYPSIYSLGKVDEKMYMLPREYAHVVVYYNKKILSAAGVDMSVVKNGWTWAQFENVASKLVQKRGSVITQYGADLQLNWPTTVLSYIYGNGGALFGEDKQSCTIDDAKTVTAYQKLKSYVDAGTFSNVFKSGMPTFVSGKVGMYFSVRAQANLINRTFGDGNWDVVSFPTMDGAEQYVGSGTTGYSVSSYSENREKAVDFLMYMMSEEGMSVIADTGLVVPSRISMNTQDANWRKYPSASINQDAFVYEPERDMLPLTTYIADPSKTSKVTDALNLATESLLKNCTIEEFNKFKKNITTAML